jgi:hypothetical protein
VKGRASGDGTGLEWKVEHNILDKKAQSPRPPWSASLAIGPSSPYRIFGVLAIRFPAGLANTPSRPNECDVRVAYMGLEEEDHSPNVTRPVSIKQAEVLIVRGQVSVKVLELVDTELNTVALCLYTHSQSPYERKVTGLLISKVRQYRSRNRWQRAESAVPSATIPKDRQYRSRNR